MFNVGDIVEVVKDCDVSSFMRQPGEVGVVVSNNFNYMYKYNVKFETKVKNMNHRMFRAEELKLNKKQSLGDFI